MQRGTPRISLLLALFVGCICLECRGPGAQESAQLGAVKPATPAAVDAPALKAKPAQVSPPKCTLQTPLKPGVPGSPGNLIPSERNPNGDSELAVLMRKMVSDLQVVRQALVNGAKPEAMPIGHERMLCAWPTDLDNRNEVFGAMAQQYLNAYKRLEEAKSDIGAQYEAVVGSCVTCHENSCRGPIPMIETLRLPTAEPAQ